MENVNEKELTIFQKVILKDHPNHDFNRHYWVEGDVIEFDENYVVLCTENKGFYKDEFIVIKGFNKGCILDIDLESTPYVSEAEYSKGSMLKLAYKYQTSKKKLVYETGDIFVDENKNLLCIKKVEQKGYIAFVIDEKETNYYKHTDIWKMNAYRDYINK